MRVTSQIQSFVLKAPREITLPFTGVRINHDLIASF